MSPPPNTQCRLSPVRLGPNYIVLTCCAHCRRCKRCVAKVTAKNPIIGNRASISGMGATLTRAHSSNPDWLASLLPKCAYRQNRSSSPRKNLTSECRRTYRRSRCRDYVRHRGSCTKARTETSTEADRARECNNASSVTQTTYYNSWLQKAWFLGMAPAVIITGISISIIIWPQFPPPPSSIAWPPLPSQALASLLA